MLTSACLERQRRGLKPAWGSAPGNGYEWMRRAEGPFQCSACEAKWHGPSALELYRGFSWAVGPGWLEAAPLALKGSRTAGNTVSITFGPKLEGGRKKDESQITNGFNMRFLAIKLNQTKSNQIKLLFFRTSRMPSSS